MSQIFVFEDAPLDVEAGVRSSMRGARVTHCFGISPQTDPLIYR